MVKDIADEKGVVKQLPLDFFTRKNLSIIRST